MERRRVPLLWGGCFLFLVLLVCFATNGFYLPNPVGVKVLQALGLFPQQSPRLMWEYTPGTGDAILPFWEEGGFSPLEEWDAHGKVVALDVKGQEHWQRELPGKVQVRAQGPNWLAADFAGCQVFFYQIDGKLAWQQRWTWPLQDVYLSPRGEVAVFLGPLWEEGINHIEKLVLVNKEGQMVWEHPLRNGAILKGGFDAEGEYFAITELLFQQEGIQNQALLLNRRGEICGEFTSPPEEIFLTTALGKDSWFLASPGLLYCLDYSGAKCWQYPFDYNLERLLADPVQDGILVISRAGGGIEAGSILFYLNRAGELCWEHSFCTPAAQLLVTATPGGIIVGDGQGIYGLGYNGDINWHYSLPHPTALFADPPGKNLLVSKADGVLALLALPE